MQYCSLQHQILLSPPDTSTAGLSSTLAPPLHYFWSYFFTLSQQHIGHLSTWGVHLPESYLFAFSYCSWGSQGKNTEVVSHSLLQRTMFCQNSPPRPVCLGLPYMTWHIVSLSFKPLAKTQYSVVKTETISAKSRNKTRIHTLATFIQYIIGCPSHSSQIIE